MSQLNAKCFVDLASLRESEALPMDVIGESVIHLPVQFVQISDKKIRIHPALAESYNRVIDTDFTRVFWSLVDEQNVSDTVHWCMLGGSFLADFAMDAAKSRIFAWGLNPQFLASHHALKKLKGRDADQIPTAACTSAENIFSFVDTDRTAISRQQLLDYMSLGPAGIRVNANDNTPHYYINDSMVQFIVPGVHSPYASLVRKFLEITGYRLMGITSGNFSSKGKYSDRSGGTHKNLDEIQGNMGFLGLPILASPIDRVTSEVSTLPELYTLLHNPYLSLSDQEKEDSIDLLPTSVTVVSPSSDGKIWKVVRHGSLHYSLIQKKLSGYDIKVVLGNEKRLDIGVY